MFNQATYFKYPCRAIRCGVIRELVYVGEGNTLKMMRRRRALGLSEVARGVCLIQRRLVRCLGRDQVERC